MENRHEQLAELFLQGREDEAVAFIDELLNEHPRLYLYEDIITPAMYHVGVLWETNEITVADEHLATAICDYVVSRLDDRFTEKESNNDKAGNKVLLLGVEKEQHYLGLKMVAGFYREMGWHVRYLGPNLPIDHAIDQINRWRPDVIGISAALSYRLPAVKQFAHRFSQLEWKPAILIGGRITRKFDLLDFISDRIYVIRGLNDLSRLHNQRGEEIIDETS
ncbi:cobalamin B12-binding domain-containing protein [Thalassobacillus pellis]|uniref:cobalamin B12-binding domain-containing protein n=1 Tax=Thalassobacillus pellis TaxID=748008 RepID=UPI00195F30F2|nr:B12-binding domain-containing protein [Thalassobacillus pellis]MBM7551283.1 methanogenic corrinoid protein MtbC1 [Thalassobacillus pellis]